MMKTSLLLGVATLAQGDGECCLSCVAPLVKYYSVDMKHGHCGESCMNPNQFALFHIFESNLTIGDGSTGYSSCADLGWPTYSETVTHGVGPIKMTLDLYNQPGTKSVEVASTCSLYEISDGSCGQSDLDCAYTGPAKAFRSTLVDGTCTEHGYSVKTGTQTMTVPFIGDITVTTYGQGLAVAETCHLYEIADGSCGQSDLDCSYTGPAKAFRNTLLDGICADQGYTVVTGTQTMTVPFIGDITVTTYGQGLAVAETCHLYEIADGSCGQSDLDCAYTGPAKAFRSTLLDGICADQGYTVVTGTQTMTVPFIGDITVTTYGQGLAVAETCSLYEMADGSCNQSDLDCAYTGPAKTFRNTLLDGNCADQGYTVKTGEQTITVPFIGDIVATTYSKGAFVV